MMDTMTVPAVEHPVSHHTIVMHTDTVTTLLTIHLTLVMRTENLQVGTGKKLMNQHLTSTKDTGGDITPQHGSGAA